MLETLRQKLGLRQQWSTWMIVGSVLAMALTVQPRLLSYIMVVANGAWMLMTREVARAERPAGTICTMCLLIAGVIIVGCVLLTLKINWLVI